jgi:uncharacterized damage-inducible protein DinB
MLDRAAAVRLFEYTSWANALTLRCAATVSVDDFKKDLGASFGGIRGTLVHTMGAEWIWLERFKGVSPRQFVDEGEFPDVVTLRDRWAAIEAHRDAWLRGLRDADLSGPLRYSNLKGEPFEAPLWQLVQHVANHSTYHRGQAVAFLKQLGARPQSTDLLTFDRERAAEGR